jgi:hopanoid biosynthesis associated protein HpnK
VKQLVVTADDFGAAGEVNEAVERAHVGGVLTAASLMVGGEAAPDAVARARRLRTLRVGLHLVLVEGRPVSDPAAVPDLVTRDGRFRTDMARFGTEIFFRPAVRQQVAAEIEAQFEAYARTGLPLDHVNTHKHFHLHPSVQALIVEIGLRYGMTAMRAPQEPRRVLRQVEPESPPPPAYVTAPWARLCRDRLRRAGIAAPDQVFGLAWSGAMTAARVGGIIARLPPGLSEIYLHPAVGAYPGSGPGYRHDEELRALVDPVVVAAARGGDLVLGGYSDFTPAAERRRAS